MTGNQIVCYLFRFIKTFEAMCMLRQTIQDNFPGPGWLIGSTLLYETLLWFFDDVLYCSYQHISLFSGFKINSFPLSGFNSFLSSNNFIFVAVLLQELIVSFLQLTVFLLCLWL